MAGIPVYFKDHDLELWFRGEAERRGLSLSQYLLVLVIQERARQAEEQAGLGRVLTKLDHVQNTLLEEIRRRPVMVAVDAVQKTLEDVPELVQQQFDTSGLGVGGWDD